MARLPIQGGDVNQWGDILNDFLATAHNTDGTLKDDAVGGLQGTPVASTAPADNQVLTYNAGTSQWEPANATGGAANATAGSPGLIQLAGDLGGTATTPTVPALTNKADTTYVDSSVASVAATAPAIMHYNTGSSSWPARTTVTSDPRR